MSADDDSGFLARWSQRKALARQGGPLVEDPPPVPATIDAAAPLGPTPHTPTEPQPPAADTPPTMECACVC